MRLLCVLLAVVISLACSGCESGEDVMFELNYECILYNATRKVCMEWQASGGTKSPVVCFPGDASVVTPEGPKAMKSLQVGDEVLGLDADGQRSFTTLRGWLHAGREVSSEMVEISTGAGSLVASHHHSVAVARSEGVSYKFAKDVAIGDMLYSEAGEHEAVVAVDRTLAKGLYGPLTHSFNLFVGAGPAATHFLAHNFAHLRYPQLYEWPMRMSLWLAEFVPNVHEVDESKKVYMHPVARMWAVLGRHLVIEV